MTSAIDARLTQPEQPGSAYLAAVWALLLAIATNTTLSLDEADVLLDAMPDHDLRDGLRVQLDVLQLREGWQARVVR